MTNEPEHAKTETKWVIGDNLYDLLRKIVNFGLPAAAIFYAALAGFLHLPYALEVMGITGALVIFLNVLLGISKKNYAQLEAEKNAAANPIVGTVYVNTKDPVEAAVGLGFDVDPEYVASKDTVTLRVNSQ